MRSILKGVLLINTHEDFWALEFLFLNTKLNTKYTAYSQ